MEDRETSPTTWPPSLTGDAADRDDVGRAVKGSDTVIVALGAGRAAGIREAGTRAVVEAMADNGVDRLISVSTRTALGKQGAAVAKRKRTGASTPKTRQELYEEAKRRDLPGRSKMGRDELARALGHR